MSALLAIGWQPELRGILITIIVVVTFCGSTYFVLSTNLGAWSRAFSWRSPRSPAGCS